MSVFTNPATGAKEAADAYTRAVLALVGDRDPMEILAATSNVFAAVVDEESPDALSTPERTGAWSIAGVLRHMADSELVWGYRIRKILTEDRPALSGYDQDRWSERLGYAEADAGASLTLFRVLRDDHLGLLARLGAADLRRAGAHAERGDEPLEHLVRLYAGHDLVHIRQIDRIRGRAT